MNVTRRMLSHLGIGEALMDDLVDEFRYGGEGQLWRQALISWVSRCRNTVLATALVAFLYRIGSYIPVPGVLLASIEELKRLAGPAPLTLADFVSGGNYSRFTIFRYGLVPYVYCSLIVQLAVSVWRLLTRRTARRPPRYAVLAAGLCALALCRWQAQADVSFLVRWAPRLPALLGVPADWVFRVAANATLLAGASLLMWVCDYITERKIANGMVVTFLGGIVAVLPEVITSPAPSFAAMATLAMNCALVAWTAQGHRRALEAKNEL